MNIENEEDLQRLIGQYESIRLDFKASELLAQPKERIIKQLAEDASAFANTEGGIIVIGIREGRAGKKSIAIEIDAGVDPVEIAPDWLEQLIASNISPPIPGLRVRPIPLSGEKAGRVAYVVFVPKGTTAYQARHSLLYYGRTEFAATALHDNVIRLLMQRPQVAHAVVEVVGVSRLTAEEEYTARHQGKTPMRMMHSDLRAHYEQPKRTFDEYTFGMQIRNDGPITIRDCLLLVTTKIPFPTAILGRAPTDQPWFFPFNADNRTVKVSDGINREEVYEHALRLFPEHVMQFPGASFAAQVPVGERITAGSLEWTLYLDNAPSQSGSIDLGRELSRTESP